MVVCESGGGAEGGGGEVEVEGGGLAGGEAGDVLDGALAEEDGSAGGVGRGVSWRST